MGQTFEPKERYAKAFGVNMKVSAKNSEVLCRAVRNKPLTRVRRLLEDLDAGKRSLGGKYYSNAVYEMIQLLNSCEKNAEFKGLDIGRLFVHASATYGTHIHRRRRKGAFGTMMKTTNMEILLIERGKEKKKEAKKPAEKKQAPSKEHTEHKHEEHKHEDHTHKEHKHEGHSHEGHIHKEEKKE